MNVCFVPSICIHISIILIFIEVCTKYCFSSNFRFSLPQESLFPPWIPSSVIYTQPYILVINHTKISTDLNKLNSYHENVTHNIETETQKKNKSLFDQHNAHSFSLPDERRYLACNFMYKLHHFCRSAEHQVMIQPWRSSMTQRVQGQFNTLQNRCSKKKKKKKKKKTKHKNVIQFESIFLQKVPTTGIKIHTHTHTHTHAWTHTHTYTHTWLRFIHVFIISNFSSESYSQPEMNVFTDFLVIYSLRLGMAQPKHLTCIPTINCSSLVCFLVVKVQLTFKVYL